MDSQLLAAMRSVVRGAEDLDPSHLKRFYTHCARRTVVLEGRHILLPLKSLLLNYTYLRPEVKTSLDKALLERWRQFTAETPPSSPRVINDRPAPEPELPPMLAYNDAPPDDGRAAARPIQEDWFDRFLNAVRCLLFL